VRGTAFLFLNNKLFRTTLINVLLLLLAAAVCAQTPEPTSSTPTPNTSSSASTENSTSRLEARIQRARALTAAHQLQTAIAELESVRRVATDDVVRNITSVMLMGIYLEEGNYIRAQSLLDEDFRARASGRDAALRTYFATAGQAINGARAHLARYRTFGINTSDQNLPTEVLNDLNRMRSLIERMGAQAKEIVSQRRGYDSLALLEDVIGIRLSIAKDPEDRATWEAEYASAREGLASSQTQIASLGVPALVTGSQQVKTTTATKEPPPEAKEPTFVTHSPPATQNVDTTSSTAAAPVSSPENENEGPEDTSTVSTGSLNGRASKRVVPPYPPIAKSSGVFGIVRVFVIVDETGKVTEVTNTDGPTLLQSAAEQAARNWRFPPTAVNGKPVRLSGYIEFNFTL
jgi:TonB family protein